MKQELDTGQATTHRRLLYESTFTALQELDETFRLDSAAFMTQQMTATQRKKEAEETLSRLKEIGDARGEHLTKRRRGLARTAINLAMHEPDVVIDRHELFNLALQLETGKFLKTDEQQHATEGMAQLDRAVSEKQAILYINDGNFSYLVDPDIQQHGLCIDTQKQSRRSENEQLLEIALPYDAIVKRSSFTRDLILSGPGQQPIQQTFMTTTAPRYSQDDPTNVTWHAPDFATQQGHKPAMRWHEKEIHDTSNVFVMGLAQIRDTIDNQTRPHSNVSKSPQGFRLAHDTWLAARVLDLNVSDFDRFFLKESIAQSAQILVGSLSYSRAITPQLKDQIPQTLLEVIRTQDAEDALYKQFIIALDSNENILSGGNGILRRESVIKAIFHELLSTT